MVTTPPPPGKNGPNKERAVVWPVRVLLPEFREYKQRHVQKTPKLSALGQNTKKYAWILVVGGQAEQRNAIAYQAVVLS